MDSMMMVLMLNVHHVLSDVKDVKDMIIFVLYVLLEEKVSQNVTVPTVLLKSKTKTVLMNVSHVTISVMVVNTECQINVLDALLQELTHQSVTVHLINMTLMDNVTNVNGNV
jgi:type 1 fimbria pilin